MRHAAPHVVGNKNGDLQMLVWQYGGSGKSGPVSGDWKCMKLDKVSGLAPNADAWATGGNHTQPQTCVGDKLEEVSY